MKKQCYMIVDDDATNNMICDFTIKRFNKEAEVKTFTVPELALTSIEKEYSIASKANATVLFLDVNMPSMTAWEFLEVFMQFDKKVKDHFTIYILSSAIQDFAEEEKSYPCIQGFFSKPLKISNLEDIKKGLLESKLH